MVSIDKALDGFGCQNQAYVVNKDFDFSAYFNHKESDYIKKRLGDEKTFIHINRFDSHVYVIITPDKNTDWQNKEVLRRKGVELFHSLNALKLSAVAIIDFSGNDDNGLATLEGFYLTSYQFISYFKDSSKKAYTVTTVHYVGGKSLEEIEENKNLWDSVFTTKNFVNQPVMSLPSYRFVEEISSLAKDKGFSATIHLKEWIEQQGMGGILAVNKGSIDPPFFCVLEWKPKKATNNKPIVLVGKGIMYDTGGLSLKPSSGMETMKADMSGASAVLGVMSALSSNRINKHVIALIPITDNRPSGNAYAPGDIVKMHNGLFVEVLNTDAEGRMILADALSYAKIFNPSLVVNIATLTGAANAAIGENAAVVMGTAEQNIISQLLDCGFNAHERLVQFPMWDDYADLIKSEIADIKNVGGPLAGAITAGKFLEKFVAYPWIHIDIAGSAYHPKGGDYRGKGATGMGVRLLYQFIKTIN